MSDEPQEDGQPAASDHSPSFDPPPPSTGAAAVSSGTERPELAVGAAFAGGFVLALILKRLAR